MVRKPLVLKPLWPYSESDPEFLKIKQEEEEKKKRDEEQAAIKKQEEEKRQAELLEAQNKAKGP